MHFVREFKLELAGCVYNTIRYDCDLCRNEIRLPVDKLSPLLLLNCSRHKMSNLTSSKTAEHKTGNMYVENLLSNGLVAVTMQNENFDFIGGKTTLTQLCFVVTKHIFQTDAGIAVLYWI